MSAIVERTVVVIPPPVPHHLSKLARLPAPTEPGCRAAPRFVLLLAVAVFIVASPPPPAPSFYNERTMERLEVKLFTRAPFEHSCNTRPPLPSSPLSALITGRPRADFPLQLFFTICTAAAPPTSASVVLVDRGPSSERRPHGK